MVVTVLTACASSSTGGARPATERSGFGSTGFAERSDWPSAALHLSRNEVRGEVLSLLLREIPGLDVTSPRGEDWGVYRVETPESARCALSLWIDGEWTGRVENPTAPLDIDSAIPVDLLLGLEVHLGMEGPVFDDQLCGAILMWTRETERWANVEFEGGVHAEVHGAAADTVIGVRVDPVGSYSPIGPGGRSSFRVLPGVYEVVFLTEEGPLARRTVRVHAYRDATIALEVTGQVAGREGPPGRGPRIQT
jgi:hypothetical protein